MRENLKARCLLFADNRNAMQTGFKMYSTMMHSYCASMYAGEDRKIDTDRIRECKDIIKNNTSFFSHFKSTAYLAMAAMLSFEDDPERTFQKVLKAYDSLGALFTSSIYLPLTAFILAGSAEEANFAAVSAAAKDIYLKMKKEHPLITSGDDYGFAVLTALSGMSPVQAVADMEKCYAMLIGTFKDAYAVQTISQMLIFEAGSAEAKCGKLIRLYEILKEKDCKFSRGMEMAVLGIFSGENCDIETVATDISDANTLMLGLKGFGVWGMGTRQRLMYAAVLTAHDYIKQPEVLDLTSINTVTSLLIAQQAAITAAITASAAAAASSST